MRRSFVAARASSRTCSRASAARASRASRSTARPGCSRRASSSTSSCATIAVVVDRLIMKEGLRTRLTDSIETALRLAEGLSRSRSSTARPSPTPRSSLVPTTACPCPSWRRASSRSTRPRRLPALHGPRLAARDRPGPGRPRPEPLDLAGCARAVDGHQLELLRAGHPGDRRPLRDRPRDAWEDLPEEQRELFLNGTGQEKVYVL